MKEGLDAFWELIQDRMNRKLIALVKNRSNHNQISHDAILLLFNFTTT